MAMMAEIKVAYDTLNKEDKSILFLKYANSLDYSSIATELQLPSDDAARMRHNRAIKKIINRLGGYRPFLDKDETNDDRENEGSKEDSATNGDDTSKDD